MGARFNQSKNFRTRLLHRYAALLLLLSAMSSFAAITEINALARVGNKVITDRQVVIDKLLEEPSLYVPGQDLRKSAGDLNQGLQRLIVQVMVSEENKIFSSHSVSSAEIDSELEAFRKKLGNHWKSFLSESKLSTGELREKLGQKILVQKALSSRIRNSSGSEQSAEKSIEEWLKQLRSRYRVQIFRSAVL